MTIDEADAMSDVLHTRMSKEGRVLIPAEMRHALGLQAEEPLKLYIVDGELRIVSRREGIRRAQAIAARYKQPGLSVVDEFIAEKRAEAQREDREGQA
jgi:bifunctional DNA-binding transcriptional regulator/antitoxin component of YhaV-PrlF toxin-antitoxin module